MLQELVFAINRQLTSCNTSFMDERRNGISSGEDKQAAAPLTFGKYVYLQSNE